MQTFDCAAIQSRARSRRLIALLYRAELGVDVYCAIRLCRSQSRRPNTQYYAARSPHRRPHIQADHVAIQSTRAEGGTSGTAPRRGRRKQRPVPCGSRDKSSMASTHQAGCTQVGVIFCTRLPLLAERGTLRSYSEQTVLVDESFDGKSRVVHSKICNVAASR